MRLLRALFAHHKFLKQERAFPENLSPQSWTLLRLMLRQPEIIHPKLRGTLLHPPRPVSIERTSTGYVAQVPDLPNCIATGRTIQQTLRKIKKAIAAHDSRDNVP